MTSSIGSEANQSGANIAALLFRSPHKSSLLQIFVSIQGLVLVREPYFTEPAFEKLRGTKEARVSSRQYKCELSLPILMSSST